MLREKLLTSGQQAAELYCAAHPQWGYIVSALLLGLGVGTILTVVGIRLTTGRRS